MAPNEALHALSAPVRLESGRRVTLRKGDALPADIAEGEAERLRKLGVFGPVRDQEVDDRDEAQVLADELVRQHEELHGSEDASGEPAVEIPEPESGDPEPEEDRVGLAAYLTTASVEEVLDRVEQEPGLAPELLDIARSADVPNDALIGALETKLGVEPAAPGVEETGESTEPVDYSTLKQPALKALLDERGIEYKKGPVSNAVLIDLLKADDEKRA